GLIDTRAGVGGMEGQVGCAGERGGSGKFTFDVCDGGLGGLGEDEVGRVEVDHGGVAIGVPFATWAFVCRKSSAGSVYVQMFAEIFCGHREDIGERHWFFRFPSHFGATNRVNAYIKSFRLCGARHPKLVRGIRSRTAFGIARTPKRQLSEGLVRRTIKSPGCNISPDDMTHSFT